MRDLPPQRSVAAAARLGRAPHRRSAPPWWFGAAALVLLLVVALMYMAFASASAPDPLRNHGLAVPAQAP